MVTLTATVTPAATGKVTFYDGTLVLGIASLSGSSAKLLVASLTSGKHALTARYDGSANSAGSLSAAVTVTVQSAPALNLLPLPAFGPSGVSSALAVDLNNDLIPDLVTIQQDGSVAIFLGTGNGAFTAGATYTVNAAQVAAGDFNGDGNVDLAFTIAQTSTVAIFLGVGDGSFGTPANITVPLADGSSVYAIQTADMNLDGQVDLVVAGSALLNTLMGNGDGTFQPPVVTAQSLPDIEGLLVGDFNSDGKPDVITRSSEYGDYFSAGNGDGTFAPGTRITALIASYTLAAADFNGDGKLDLLSNGEFGDQVLLGNGDGTFGSAVTLDSSYTSVGDLNGDGKLDVFSNTSIGYGNGDGTFQPAIAYSVATSSLLAVADVNDNGQMDLISRDNNGNIEVFLGTDTSSILLTASPNPATYNSVLTLSATVTPVAATGTVTFYDGSTALGTSPLAAGVAILTVTASASGRRLLSARYSGDAVTQTANSTPLTLAVHGTPSTVTLAASSSTPTYGQALTLTASISPSSASGTVTFSDSGAVLGVASVHSGLAIFSTVNLATGVHSLSGEYDGGGSIGAGVSPSISVTVASLPAGAFDNQVQVAIGPGGTAVFTADLNRDGLTDLIVTNQASSISVLLATGPGTYASGTTYAVGGSATTVIVADFNNDGFSDLLVPASTGMTILLGNGDGSFRPGTTLSIAASLAAVADFNRDGNVDIVFSQPQINSISVLLGNGDGTFQLPFAIPLSSPAQLLNTADLNGDGNADLVVSIGSSNLLIYLGTRNATFAAPITVPLTNSASALAIADLNHDGKPDVVVAEGEAFAVLLGNGDGTFTAGLTYNDGTYPNAIYLADMNGDGNIDVVIPEGYVTYLFGGNGDGTFRTAASFYAAVGSSVALGNFFDSGRVSAGGIYNSTLTLYSNVRPASVSLTVSPSPGTLGQPITLTAIVTPHDGTGTVEFFDGSSPIGTAPVISGIATFRTSALTANRHVLSAGYSGDSNTGYANSNYFIETVTGNPASVILSSSAATLTYGHPISLTATISPHTAAGVITYFSGAQVLGSVPLQNGVARVTTSLLPAGNQSIRAVYEGDASYTAGAASSVIPVRVNTVPGSSFRYEPISGFFNTIPAATADFNDDGIPDLLVQSIPNSRFPGSLGILLGQGDGSFQPGWSSTYGGAPYGSATPVVVADFNGDGSPDFAVMDDNDYSVVIYLNQGDGTFAQPVSTTGFQAVAMAVSDFNGDGIPDLLVVDFDLNIQVLTGVGDGTFLPFSQSFPGGNSQSGLTSVIAADFNGDGKADLAISGYDSNAISIFLGNGDATFQPPVDIGLGVASGTILSADLNGDGVADLAVLTGPGVYTLDSLAVLVGNSNGTFQTPATYAGLTSASSLAVSDFNGDGKLDLAIGNATSFATLYGNGDGTLQTANVFPEFANGLVVADYNGDGRPDFPGLLGALADTVSLSSSSATVPVDGTVTLTVTISPSAATGNVTFYDGAVVLGNVPAVNGTAVLQTQIPIGGLQQVTAKYQGDSSYNYQTSAIVPVSVTTIPGGTFGNAVSYPAGAGPSAVTTGDFNHDGFLDIAVANQQDNTVSVLWGSGNGVFGSRSTFPAGNQPVAIVSGDLNGDGIPDIIVGNAGSSSLTVLLSSAGSLTPGTAVPLTAPPFGLAAGDLNGDGRIDVVVTGVSGSTSLLLGNGDGTLTPDVGANLFQTNTQIALGDFNGDGNQDILVGSFEFLGDGHGNFSEQTVYTAENSIFTTADFNKDGKLDIAGITYGSAAVSVSLGNGDGTFQNPVSFPTTGAANYVATGDFNGDGFPDLALVNLAGSVGLMIGNGDGSFQPETTYLAGTQPVSLALADFNGDGRLDLAVANAGSNNVSVLPGAVTSCTYVLTPSVFDLPQSGGNATVSLIASAPSCAWTADFVQSYNPTIVAPVSGTGTGSFTLSIPYNPTGAPATGTIEVANQQLPVYIAETDQIFQDVPPTAYYFDAVNLLDQKGITDGCTQTDFCPTEEVTRAQMAIFIVRGILGTGTFTYTPTPYFTDVPTGAFGFEYIQKLRDLGITSGCAPTLFCPDDSITRAQAAIFLIRARYGVSTMFPYPTTPYFADVPADAFGFEWIQRLRADNITSGCSPTEFCPDNPVLRGDMAIFVMRALFNQLLPAGEPVIASANPVLGTEISFDVYGSNTHFEQGATQVIVPGYATIQIFVSSPTALTVYVSNDFVPGPVSVIVITGQEVAVGPNLL